MFLAMQVSRKNLYKFVILVLGTGKSFLMKVLIEASKYILRADTDDFKHPRVAVTAPTAVAAKLVEGRTIDSAFQTFSQNNYGVDLMEPGRKANLDDEWKDLGNIYKDCG